MMMRMAAGAAALALFAGPLAAQQFSGAELSVEALSFEDDDEISQTTYRGSVEFGLPAGFGVAADLSFYDVGESDGVKNLTAHVLYDAFAFGTVGAFYARDENDDFDAQTFGVEGGRSFGALGVEAHVGFGDDSGDDFRLLGVDSVYDLNSAFSVTGSAALLDADGGTVNRLALGGEYRFGTGPAVYAEVGRVDIDDDALGDLGEATFLGIGARIAIGPNGGTTFRPRGIYETLTGL